MNASVHCFLGIDVVNGVKDAVDVDEHDGFNFLGHFEGEPEGLLVDDARVLYPRLATQEEASPTWYEHLADGVKSGDVYRRGLGSKIRFLLTAVSIRGICLSVGCFRCIGIRDPSLEDLQAFPYHVVV